MIKETIAFIGGDKRQIYSAKSLEKANYNVVLVGFENYLLKDKLNVTSLDFALKNCGVFIFPVTGVMKNKVPAKYSENDIILTNDILEQMKSKIIFSGKSDSLQSLSSELRIYDYLRREEFAVANALPTAEGAIQIAMENYVGTIFGSRCLVIGYGRIGKVLSKMLKSLNANVTVSARKNHHLKYIQTDGNNPIRTEEIATLENYDIVFNTVPKLIINKNLLAKTKSDTIIIDLASAPGGVDFDFAEKINVKAIQALSLPGKSAPKTAGEIISDTILEIFKEEYRWQKLI